MQPDKLITMANQIAKYFETQGEERALPQIASHIEKFWDPRMRKQIIAHMQNGGEGLDPLAKKALAALKPFVPQAQS